MENALETIATEPAVAEAIVEAVPYLQWLWYGLQVAVVGMLVVFVGLIVLIGCIRALTRAVNRMGQDAAPAAAHAPMAQPVDVGETADARETDEGELVAVISAAIAAILASEQAAPQGSLEQTDTEPEILDGFVVRSIRRVSSAPAWNRAGREEQVYSRL